MLSRVATAAVRRLGGVHRGAVCASPVVQTAVRAAAGCGVIAKAVAAPVPTTVHCRFMAVARSPVLLEQEDGGVFYSSVFCSNLPYNLSTQEVRAFFEQAGPVHHVELFSRRGVPTGTGVVAFLDTESALNACETLHDAELGGRLVLVRENRKPAHRKNYQLLLRNLPGGTQWWEVKDLVRGLAPVLHVAKQGNRALVQIADDDAVEAVCDELNRRTLFNVKLQCEITGTNTDLRGGFQATQKHQVLVRNLPKYVDWQEVKDLFKEFGECEHVQVKDGMAIVRMSFDEDAQAAIEELNGANLFGHTVEVMRRNA